MWSLTRLFNAGVYSVTFTAIGDFTSAAPQTSTILVVYDPTTFATGGGYVLTSSATVPTIAAGKKANYGFNVKYQSDNVTPAGSLLYQLKEANIDFKSTSFDWLVISNDGAGKRAEFQGKGTINGAGSYTFTVVARDMPTGDTFSIEIRDSASTLVASQSGPAAGGNITIH
jgi:hypothetical protein